VSKNFGRLQNDHGNFEGASKSMDVFILGRHVHGWSANRNITGLVHNEDASSRAVLK
jgi:hypothetical protein